MMTIEQRNSDFYSEKGLKALTARVQSWIDIYNKNQFPFKAQLLEFGKFEIQTREECEARIKELCEILGAQVKKEIIEEMGEDDKMINREVMVW